jgi:hypothetical protein
MLAEAWWNKSDRKIWEGCSVFNVEYDRWDENGDMRVSRSVFMSMVDVMKWFEGQN